MGLRIDKSVAITVLIVATLMVQVRCQRPQVINLGAVFTFDSVIGRAAKVALEAAVSDVNADTSLLQETELRLFVEDSSCNVFHGSFAGTMIVLLLQNTCAHQLCYGTSVPLLVQTGPAQQDEGPGTIFF